MNKNYIKLMVRDGKISVTREDKELTIKEVADIDTTKESNGALLTLSKFFKDAKRNKQIIEEKDKRIAELEKELRDTKEIPYIHENKESYDIKPLSILTDEHIEKINNEMKVFLDIKSNVLYSFPEKKTKHSSEIVELLKRFIKEQMMHIELHDGKGNIKVYNYNLFESGRGLFDLIKDDLYELDKALKNKKYIPKLSGISFYKSLNGREVECIQEHFYIEREDYGLPYSNGGYFRPSEKTNNKSKGSK